jgi:predicted Zn-dependent peptidase
VIKKTMPLLLALVAGAALAGEPDQRPVDKLKIPPLREFTPPAAKSVKLANGIQAFILEDHELPLVEVEVILRAGSVWDPADEVGLASVAGSVWRKGGTKTHPKEKLDEVLEARGATLEAGIGHDQGSIHLSCLKEDLELGLSLMKELLTEPLFPDDKLEETKTEELSGIDRRNDQAPPIASRIFAMQVYGKKSPFAREVTADSINKITRDDLLAWHKQFVRPSNMLLGAFGDQTADELEKKLGAALGEIAGAGDAPRPEMPLVEVAKKAAWLLIDKPEVNQSALEIGHIGGVRSPTAIDDYARVLVMNSVLGGGGFSSRLMLRVRSDQGLAYSVGSAFGWEYDHPGTLRMVCETKSESTVKAIGSLLHELDEIRKEPPTDEELAVAKESILNTFPFLIDTKEKLVDNALRYAYRGFPQDTLRRVAEGIAKVTREDVLATAKAVWSPEALVVVVCGNVADFDPAPLKAKEERDLDKDRQRGLDALSKIAKTKVETIADPEGWAVDKAAAPPAAEGGSNPPAAKDGASSILDKLLAASGGKEAIDGLKILKLKQTMTQDDTTEAEELLIQFPDKERRVMERDGQKITLIYDGKKGAAVVAQGTFALPAGQLAAIRAEITGMTAAVLKAIARGDATLASESDDTIGGKAAKKVVLDMKGGKKQILFVDPSTGALLGKAQEGGGQKIRIAVDESKSIGGVVLPTKLSIRLESDKPDAEPKATLAITEAEGNPKVADDAFVVPEAKEMPKDKDDDDDK